MQRTRFNLWFVVGLLTLALATGCPPADNSGSDGAGADSVEPSDGTEPAADLEGRIDIDGSSTVYPISQAVAVDFMKKYPKVNVTVGVSGTGGGFKRFSAGETDVSDASRPIKDSEFAKCKEAGVNFVEVPVAYDGLSIVIHPDNDFVKELTVGDLKKIFLAQAPRHGKRSTQPGRKRRLRCTLLVGYRFSDPELSVANR